MVVYLVFLCLSQSRLTGGIMFTTWPFVRYICPFVSFVHYQNCEHDILKTNEPILVPIGTNGQRAWNFQLWELRGQRLRIHEGKIGHRNLCCWDLKNCLANFNPNLVGKYLYLSRLTSSFTCQLISIIVTTLIIHTPSLIHSRLRTYLFNKSFPP